MEVAEHKDPFGCSPVFPYPSMIVDSLLLQLKVSLLQEISLRHCFLGQIKISRKIQKTKTYTLFFFFFTIIYNPH